MSTAIDRVSAMHPRARSALRRQHWLLLALVALVCSSGIGLRDPMPPDEPRFVLVAREMAATGEWLIPHRNGELYPDKPPLFMWLIAAGTRLTGSEAIGFLLPLLAAALVAFACVHDLAARLWGRRAALAGGLALLTTVQFAWQARFAQIDMLLVGCTTVALYGIVRHILLGPAWGWWYAAGVAMGLGIISKGVGFLPLLALIPWSIARFRRADRAVSPVGAGCTWWRWALGPLAMAAVVACWLIPMLWRVAHDPSLAAYRDDILIHQTAKRYADPDHHFRPPWHYLVNAPGLWLPLVGALPWIGPAWWRRVRRGDARLWLLLGWAALVVLFFSISPAKRGVYVFPALPALVVAAAAPLAAIARRCAVRRAGLIATGILAAAALAGAAISLWVRLPAKLASELSDQNLNAADFAPALIAIGLGSLACAVVWRRRGLVALVAASCVAWFAFGWLGYPALAGRSPRAFMARVDAAVGPAELGMIDWREQYVLQSPRPITTFGYAGKVTLAAENRAALEWLLAAPARQLLVPRHRLQAFTGQSVREIGFQNGSAWSLVAADPVLP